MGITASSESLSAVNCEASFVKTVVGSVCARYVGAAVLTQTWREKLRVEVGKKLLVLCIKMAHSRHNIARQTDADDLHYSLEYQQRQIGEVWVRAVLLLEHLHEAIAAIVV